MKKYENILIDASWNKVADAKNQIMVKGEWNSTTLLAETAIIGNHGKLQAHYGDNSFSFDAECGHHRVNLMSNYLLEENNAGFMAALTSTFPIMEDIQLDLYYKLATSGSRNVLSSQVSMLLTAQGIILHLSCAFQAKNHHAPS